MPSPDSLDGLFPSRSFININVELPALRTGVHYYHKDQLNVGDW